MSIAPSSFAELIDLTQLEEPRSYFTFRSPAPVVASPVGLFLAEGQRITPTGENLDGGSVQGAEGHILPWHDGWMIIRNRYPEWAVLHLGASGPPRFLYELRADGAFLGVASTGQRAAILEQVQIGFGPALRLTIIDQGGIRSVGYLPGSSTAAIRAFQDQFLVVARVTKGGPDPHSTFTARLIDVNGLVRQESEISMTGFSSWLSLTSGEAAAFLITGGEEEKLFVLDQHLTWDPVSLPALDAPEVDLGGFFVLTLEQGFLLSYRIGQSSFWRNAIVNDPGVVVEDGQGDPIVAGDRLGDTYLVARPWADYGIARHDPRMISTAFQLMRREYATSDSLDTVVSEDVTLVLSHRGRVITRFDAAGNLIDEEALTIDRDAKAAATQYGFIFASVSRSSHMNRIRIKRLSRLDGWIDENWVWVAEETQVRDVGVAPHPRGALLAWVTDEELVWTFVDTDGPLSEPELRRTARVGAGDFTSLGLTAAEGEVLLLMSESFLCPITCVPGSGGSHDAVVIHSSGEAGPLQRTVQWGGPTEAVRLPDTTWVAADPAGGLMHFSSDGALLQRSRIPLLMNPEDLQPSPGGWTATASDPARIIELSGLDAVVSLTGLEDVDSPHFGFDSWLTFLSDSPGPEDVLVPWSGRIDAVGGDLSVELIERGDGFVIEVRNHGSTPAAARVTGHWVDYTAPRWAGEIDDIPAGESRSLFAPGFHSRESYFLVLSADVADRNPGNNIAYTSEATRMERQRPVRRK